MENARSIDEAKVPTRRSGITLHRCCDVSAALGVAILIGMAVMTSLSVLGRAAFASPILGDVELVQLGCAVVVACFLPYTQHQRANIIVDFFTASASARTQARLDALGTFLYTIVMAVVTWRVAVGGWAVKESQERSMLMGLPLWWAYALMLPGLTLCVLIGASQLIQHCRGEQDAVSGEDR